MRRGESDSVRIAARQPAILTECPPGVIEIEIVIGIEIDRRS